jgi:uridine kinase
MTGPVLVLGIAGGSGSGKSTIVQRLLQGPAGTEICHLCHDAYYHDLNCLPKFPDGAGNWDHPDSLDNALFVSQLDSLRRGESVQRPIYDFASHRRNSATEHLQPRRILLLEGIRDRGRSLESVADQYQRSVRPMHEEHVEPSRRYADIWIPWSEDNPAAVQVLTAKLCAWLQEHR